MPKARANTGRDSFSFPFVAVFLDYKAAESQTSMSTDTAGRWRPVAEPTALAQIHNVRARAPDRMATRVVGPQTSLKRPKFRLKEPRFHETSHIAHMLISTLNLPHINTKGTLHPL